jgi:hypothetical protein
MRCMPKLLSAFVATGFALAMSTAIAQNADPYKQKDTTGASQQQADPTAMKEKLKQCRKLSGQAKQDCINDAQAGQGSSTTGAGSDQPDPQSGQAPAPDQTKRRQQ